MEYMIVTTTSQKPEDHIKAVNRKIAEGWVPQGGVFVDRAHNVLSGAFVLYHQAMIRTADTQKSSIKESSISKSNVNRDAKYYFVSNRKEQGPYSIAQLEFMLQNGEVNSSIMVRAESETGYSRSQRLKDILG